jgi:multidrug efflux pump subunit AcrA (membrane-fusion protein)
MLLRTDAFMGRKLVGTVREVTLIGDPVAKTYRINAALPDDTPLLPGMSVEANVVTREKPEALLIPSDAVQGTSVFVIDGQRVQKRTIELGIRGTRAVEVLSGLAASEQVASPAPTTLADGRRVRVTAKAEAAP